ncbi:mucin-22 [Alosa sapidissima]|uniref:mucin-22 n=1 Tax=Alosa sapidissima TaxID=34773 RepID=UPI001C08AE79|nr:mucin-22 [Alosa sapidissima]
MWSVFFVFLSYLDGEFVKADFLSNSLEAEKESKELFYLLNNTLCAKRSNVGEYHLLQVSDGIEEVRSVHDATGKLVDCALTTDQMQVKSFMYVCKLGLRGQVTIPTALNPSFTNITDIKLKCLQLKSKRSTDAASQLPVRERGKVERKGTESSILRRSKRGFTYPGTLWCGAGNNAENYDQLGEFAETDNCCRVHDHCPHVIHAFSSNYGYTNFKWHPISHCDCDNALKACLREVNDTSSRVVGQAFFNVIEAPCFEFSYEEQCVERHWYGVCKRYDKVPVAVLKESIAYDFGGIDVIDDLPLPPLENTEEPGIEPEETPEGAGTAQSTGSGSQTTTPEAPSLTNMVTAAEDFIKVLATVSTSQGSSPDATKEETQGSEKKRKKNAGGKKRKNKKRRGKGKGRKRRPSVETVVKTDEGAVGAPSCHVPEEVSSRINIIEDPALTKQAEANVDNFMRSEADLEAKEELSNTMMRDEPQRAAGAMSPAESAKEESPKDKDDDKRTLSATASPTLTVNMGIIKTKTHRERVRLGQKRLRHMLRAATPSPNTPKANEDTQEDQSITASVRDGSDSTTVESRQAEAAGQPSSGTLGNASEEGPVATTAGAPTTKPSRAKRPRSKERGMGGGRKRAGKVIPPLEEGEGPQHTGSEEEPTGGTPVVSASEVSTLGYHVPPKRLDYQSVARLAPPPISKPVEPSRKGKQQRSRESRERRKIGHIFGTTLTPILTPTSTHTVPVQNPDKADYEVMLTAGVSANTVPPQSDTSTLAQQRPTVKDTSTQETPLFLLTGIPPGDPQKPKHKKQERRERKKQRKVFAVLSSV